MPRVEFCLPSAGPQARGARRRRAPDAPGHRRNHPARRRFRPAGVAGRRVAIALH